MRDAAPWLQLRNHVWTRSGFIEHMIHCILIWWHTCLGDDIINAQCMLSNNHSRSCVFALLKFIWNWHFVILDSCDNGFVEHFANRLRFCHQSLHIRRGKIGGNLSRERTIGMDMKKAIKLVEFQNFSWSSNYMVMVAGISIILRYTQ